MDGNEYASIMTDKNRRQTFCDGGEEEFLRLASLHMRWLSSSNAAITKERDKALAENKELKEKVFSMTSSAREYKQLWREAGEERNQLREKLAAMESQEPYVTLHAEGEGYRIEWHHPWTLMAGSQSFYIKPVPADKPAVAVPDGYRLLPFPPTKEMCEAAPSMPAIELPKDLELTKSGWKPNEIQNLKRFIAMANAAPSHSQQSANDEWRPLTGFGQVGAGDWLSFKVGDNFICATAKEILNPGKPDEEIIYNRKRNHYFISSLAIIGQSSHKQVMFRSAKSRIADRCPSHEIEQGGLV